MRVYTYTYVLRTKCIYVGMCEYVCVSIYIREMYLRRYIYIYMCVLCMCMCVYIYVYVMYTYIEAKDTYVIPTRAKGSER